MARIQNLGRAVGQMSSGREAIVQQRSGKWPAAYKPEKWNQHFCAGREGLLCTQRVALNLQALVCERFTFEIVTIKPQTGKKPGCLSG